MNLVTDLSKQTEQERDFLSSLAINCTNGIIAIDHEHKICVANKAVMAKTGHSELYLTGLDFNELLEPEVREKHREHLKKWFSDPIAADLHSRDHEFILTGRKGGIRCKVSIRPYYIRNTSMTTSEKPKCLGIADIVWIDE